MELIISSKDFNTISSLLKNQTNRHQIKETLQLLKELKKMKIIEPEKIPETLVGINSEVGILEVVSGKTMNFKITLPSMANFKENRISIFAPISIALLGFKKGDTIEWNMPGGLKKIKITRVKNLQND